MESKQIQKNATMEQGMSHAGQVMRALAHIATTHAKQILSMASIAGMEKGIRHLNHAKDQTWEETPAKLLDTGQET